MMIMKILALIGFLFLPVAFAVPPPNDECVNATVIPSNRGVLTPYITSPVQIQEVTANKIDPITQCNVFSFDDPRGTDGVTLWYVWSPSITGFYDFTTAGSFSDEGELGGFEISTILGIFQGETCASTVELTCSFTGNPIRAVELDAGTKYFIKVGTFDDEFGGAIKLTVKPTPPPPANAQCGNAISVDPLAPKVVTGTITNALIDGSLYNFCASSFVSNLGLWYKLENVLQSPLSVVVSTCYETTQFDTLINIFQGDDCGSLECIGGIDDVFDGDCGFSARFSFIAEPMKTYYILVQGYDLSEGNFTLTVEGSTNYFTLIDSETDKFVEVIDTVVNYNQITTTTSKLNIQAVFDDDIPIESVLVTYDSPVRSYCEEFFPYSLFLDNDGDYDGATITVGTHKVTATTYAQSGCSGPAGVSINKTFEVIGCGAYFEIYNVTSTSRFGSFFAELYNDPFFGFQYEFDSLPCDLNVQAITFCPFIIGEVQIELLNAITNTVVTSKTEVVYPYYLFGNDGDVLNSGSIGPGTYNITASFDGVKSPPIQFKVLNACSSV
jgi:hypothetical protein